MPYRADVFRPGHYYHLYNRGVDGGLIFFNSANHQYCLKLIERYSQPHGVTVIAYCLMPNHYHLLVRQETDEPVSTFVQLLFNSYVQGVNRQQGRRGPLFQGRFRHVLVDRDEYLMQLCRYIHLNPVRANLVSSPEEWRWSNYSQWIGKTGRAFTDFVRVTDQLASPIRYRSFVASYLDESRPPAEIERYLLE